MVVRRNKLDSKARNMRWLNSHMAGVELALVAVVAVQQLC